MNRPPAGTAVLLALLVGCADSVEIPTVELGGSGGARLMNAQAKNPAEAYDNAYSQLTRAHYNVRRNLEVRSQNLYGAREAMAQIVRILETLRACVPAEDQAKYDPYIARYNAWLKEVNNGTWGGSFLTDFERSEQEVKTKFSPSTTAVLKEFPGVAPAPKAEPTPTDPKAPGSLTADKVEVPAAKPPADAPAPKPPSTAPNSEAAARVLYRSWERAHEDLIAAYKEKKECKSKYQDLAECLRMMKANYSGDPAATLQIYMDYYAAIDEKTKSFTILPEKTTEKDIVDELEVAARVIRKQYNPDPKK